MKWYVLFVETGSEHIVKQSIRRLLKDSDMECLAPSRRIQERRQGQTHTVTRLMFPGYLFLRAKMSLCMYQTLRNVHRLFRILRYEANHNEPWSAIDDAEMEPILQLVRKGEVIECSTVVVENASVYVKCGPLQGMEGIIRKIDRRKNRAKIALYLMGRKHLIDVGIEVLSEPVTEKSKVINTFEAIGNHI